MLHWNEVWSIACKARFKMTTLKKMSTTFFKVMNQCRLERRWNRSSIHWTLPKEELPRDWWTWQVLSRCRRLRLWLTRWPSCPTTAERQEAEEVSPTSIGNHANLLSPELLEEPHEQLQKPLVPLWERLNNQELDSQLRFAATLQVRYTKEPAKPISPRATRGSQLSWDSPVRYNCRIKPGLNGTWSRMRKFLELT